MPRLFLLHSALALTALLLALAAPLDAASAEPVRITHESAEDCSIPCDRTAVVFIHGIIGSKATWSADSSNGYWPDLLATDPSLGSKLDVYRVDYDSFLFEAGPSIVDVLRSLQTQLDEIFLKKQYKTAILIGHSLGGNIARAYLMHVKARFGHRALSTFRLTFTLGTPVLGSELATIARVGSSNQQLRVLLPIKVNDFGQFLNLTLSDIENKHQQVYCPRLYRFAAFEEKPLPVVGLVVSKASATADSNESMGFSEDHISISKPKDRSSDIYVWVKDKIAACLKPFKDRGFEGSCNYPLMLCGQTPEGWPNSRFDLVPRLEPGASAPLSKVPNP